MYVPPKLDIRFSQGLGDVNHSVYRKGLPYKQNGEQGVFSGGPRLGKDAQVEYSLKNTNCTPLPPA